jgi:hypothetical protein
LLVLYFVGLNITIIIAYLPNLEPIRDLCVALFASLPLWVVPVVGLWSGRCDSVVERYEILATRCVVLPMEESVSYAEERETVSSEAGP